MKTKNKTIKEDEKLKREINNILEDYAFTDDHRGLLVEVYDRDPLVREMLKFIKQREEANDKEWKKKIEEAIQYLQNDDPFGKAMEILKELKQKYSDGNKS